MHKTLHSNHGSYDNKQIGSNMLLHFIHNDVCFIHILMLENLPLFKEAELIHILAILNLIFIFIINQNCINYIWCDWILNRLKTSRMDD